MSDTDNYGDESIDTDLGSYSVDDEDQPDSRGLARRPWPGRRAGRGLLPAGEAARASNAFGTTAAEQHQGESLEQRIAQEEPDPAAYVDDPLAEPRHRRRRRPRRDRGRPGLPGRPRGRQRPLRAPGRARRGVARGRRVRPDRRRRRHRRRRGARPRRPRCTSWTSPDPPARPPQPPSRADPHRAAAARRPARPWRRARRLRWHTDPHAATGAGTAQGPPAPALHRLDAPRARCSTSPTKHGIRLPDGADHRVAAAAARHRRARLVPVPAALRHRPGVRARRGGHAPHRARGGARTTPPRGRAGWRSRSTRRRTHRSSAASRRRWRSCWTRPGPSRRRPGSASASSSRPPGCGTRWTRARWPGSPPATPARGRARWSGSG